MALTRLQNIISSVEGRILYVNPDDFDATDAIDNKGNSPIRPFKTIARAVLEVARYSYVSAGNADDKFDQFTILLYPGDHIVDNRPGTDAYAINAGNYVAGVGTFTDTPQPGNYGWNAATKQYDELYKITNAPRGGLIIPRGTSIIGLDLRKTKIRPKYVPSGGTNTAPTEVTLNYTADPNNLSQITIDQVAIGGTPTDINDLILESAFEKGVLGPKFFTPTGAAYTASTGDLVLDLGAGHGLTVNDFIKINTNSLTYECSMDGNSQRKTYPRPSDPYANTQIPVDSVTNSTITVNVGPSPNIQHNVTNATYSATTGIMQVNIGSGHGISVGETVKIADNSMRFTCDMDNTNDVKTYPRNLIKTFTASDASYDPNTGIVTITVNNHGMDDGSWVKIADNSLTFSCGFGGATGAAAEKSYPRSTDPISGHWIPVSNTTTNTFDIQSLHDIPSTNLDPHSFVSAVADGITHKVDRSFDSPVEVVGADNNAGTIDLQVGKSPIVNWDVTDANFSHTNGDLELTIGAHDFAIGQHIKLADNSLSFECTLNPGVAKTYPRASGEGANAGTPDYAYQKSLEITAVTATTITVNATGGGPISQGGTHTYVGGTASNAVIAGGDYNHVWQVGYTATNAITSGGDYVHTFISALNDSVVAETGIVVIEPGTKISSIDTQLGSSTIKVNLSKPHAYTSANGYSTNTSETGKIVKIPYEDDNSRAALFRITGGCYFWQFTMLDGDPVGIYNTSTVEPQSSWPGLVSPVRSHTKLTIFEFASQHDLFHFYRKVADSITLINAEKIEPKIQENRIVGALGDQVNILSVSRNSNIVTVTLEEELNLTANNFVVIAGDITGNAGINPYYVGEKEVSSVITKTQFTFQLTPSDEGGLNSLEVDQDVNTANWQVTYTPTGSTAQVEIDTVESASPYIFNISLRSTYGTCGMHADGSRASGFKSMVVAQYTGISLQKDDGAFLKYSEGSGVYSNDGTTAYHTDINAVYNPLQRSYHVKASNRAVIQAVSVFAVGFADHFIAEDGGDMSVTNSNSNFGSNAMRSIGFSDVAFNKDALGEITHIIPPRNIESTDTNFYWESIDTQATTNSRIYLTGRTDPATITTGGSKFNPTVTQTVGGVTWVLGTTNGVVTSITSYTGLGTSNLQPGDVITIDAPSNYQDPSSPGLPCTLTVGGSLTTKAGKFTVGGRTKNKDGSTVKDKIYVPLYVSGSQSTSEQFAEIDPNNSPQGNIFDYDVSTTQWYVNVSVGSNSIFNTINGNPSKYGPSGILSTPSSYLKRIVDERVDNDKIYRLRYVTKRDPNTGILPSFPQTGYVLQVKKGSGIPGIGDRFTDGANLLLLNKRFLAWETVARYKAANPTYTVPDVNGDGGDWNCQDDIISIIDAVAYNLRYGGNNEVFDAANLYNTLVAGQYLGSRDVIVDMIDTYLRPLMQSVIYNTAVSGAILNRNPANTANIYFDQVIINNPANLNYAQGTCANVRNSSYTLLNIVTTALGTDASPGTLQGVVTRTPPSETYTRRSGFNFDDVYYVFDVEEITPYAFDGTNETPGVYYLTIVKGSIGVDTSVLPGNTFKFSQNTDTLIPKIDIDNPVSDPIIARSSADPVLIGAVKTSTGYNAATTDPADSSFSITKEAISCYFYEYFNNELEWTWAGENTVNSKVTHTVNNNNPDGTHSETVVTIQSGDGDGEIRKIDINPTRSGDTYAIELRRPSTIRSGNHTFEYVGFGPGNYSTAFPIKQTKILSPDEQKYAQSLKEQGGIAFYSGLNSNGDLYIGNTVINAVTGKTTENEITELKELTITDNLNVIGGSGNILNTNFQGPVTFLKSITGEGDNIFSSISLRNADGIISKLINNDATPTGGATGDFQFNTDPQHGGYFGWSKGADGVWRTSGLTELDKIHSYKDGSNYCLNIGSDIVDLSSDTTINTNYALDITTNQRIGGYLDIGSPSDKATAITSNTTNKDTQLSVFQNWTNNTSVFKPIEVTIQPGAFTGATGSSLIDLRNGTDSVFNVDKDGNVAIKEGSTYGISDNAFFLKLEVVSNANALNSTNIAANQISFSGPSTTMTDVFSYSGASKGGEITTLSFGFKTNASLDQYTTTGSSTGGAMYWTQFNARSILLFVNGVLQEPYEDYDFDGSLIYMNQIGTGDIITIRALAN